MTRFFLDVINLSIAGSWLILAVIAIRFLFKKRVPKWVNCLLWSFVGIRLVLPFTLESAFSLSPNREIINIDAVYGEVQPEPAPPVQSEGQIGVGNVNNNTQSGTEDNQIMPNGKPVLEFYPETEYFQSGIEILDDRINPVINGTVSSVSPSEENPLHNFLDTACYIWLAGTVMLFTYAAINYFLLKRRVATAIPYENNARRCDRINTPFILGVFRPKIYLPFGLSPATEESVVAHENAHLRRKDHLIKPIAYFILSVYWFNPLIWVAYILLCRDIESACDEKVIKDMSAEARKAYATALLECSVRKSYIVACPLAFGEIGVKNRVKNTMNYRKPAFWIIISAVVICAIVSVLFLTSPDKSEKGDTSETVSEDMSKIEYSDISDSGVSNDISSSDTSEYIGEVSDNDNVSLESSDIDVSEEVSDEVSEEESVEESTPAVDNSVTHAHSFELVYDETGHWQQCGCGEEQVLSTHSFATGEFFSDGTKQQWCTVCYYSKTVTYTSPAPSTYMEFELSSDGTYYSIVGYTGDVSDLVIPSVHNGKPVKKIGFSAFREKGRFNSVYIPGSITHIGARAFESTRIDNVYFSFGLKEIGESAFAYCYLEELKLPNSLEKIGPYAFRSNWLITQLYIPGSVVQIDTGAFYQTDSLRLIYISKSVQIIGTNAFFSHSSQTKRILCEADEKPDGWLDGWKAGCYGYIEWNCAYSRYKYFVDNFDYWF